MPIRIQADLPAIEVLESENIFVMTHERAQTQDIRPLEDRHPQPDAHQDRDGDPAAASAGEHPPSRVDVELLHTASHISRHTSSSHLHTFYKTFGEVRDQKFDGLIITGAPVEQMPFEEVDYWPEMCDIMEWSKGERLLGAPHLLGGPGRAILSLWHPQVPPCRKSSAASSTTRS